MLDRFDVLFGRLYIQTHLLLVPIPSTFHNDKTVQENLKNVETQVQEEKVQYILKCLQNKL